MVCWGLTLPSKEGMTMVGWGWGGGGWLRTGGGGGACRVVVLFVRNPAHPRKMSATLEHQRINQGLIHTLTPLTACDVLATLLYMTIGSSARLPGTRYGAIDLRPPFAAAHPLPMIMCHGGLHTKRGRIMAEQLKQTSPSS